MCVFINWISQFRLQLKKDGVLCSYRRSTKLHIKNYTYIDFGGVKVIWFASTVIHSMPRHFERLHFSTLTHIEQ